LNLDIGVCLGFGAWDLGFNLRVFDLAKGGVRDE
jgi:hypothetical protein